MLQMSEWANQDESNSSGRELLSIEKLAPWVWLMQSVVSLWYLTVGHAVPAAESARRNLAVGHGMVAGSSVTRPPGCDHGRDN